MANKAEKGFDINLEEGLAGEGFIKDLLLSVGCKKCEVKTDMRWHETGNIFIETGCWENKHRQFRSSGAFASKSEYWFEVLPGSNGIPMIIGLPIDILKEAILNHGQPRQQNKSENPSHGYLLKLENLIAEFVNDAVQSRKAS